MFLRNNYGLDDADENDPKEFPVLRRLSYLSDQDPFAFLGIWVH